MGTRIGAFVIDLALAFGISWLFTRPELPKNWSLVVWALLTLLFVAVGGFTPGQYLLGIRVAPIGSNDTVRRYVGLWALPRTALIFLIVPVLFADKDGRGLHDRWCRTVVIRARR